jgi:hypothetical protein
MIELRCAAARLRAGFGKCLLLVSLASLGGCAAFQGQPDPVISRSDAADPSGYSLQRALGPLNMTVLGVYHSPNDDDRCVTVGPGATRCGLDQEQYRNYVIGAYLAAANDRYGEFTRRLRLQSRGSSVALDIGALGLSAGASLAGERTANVLGAIAAALGGTRATLEREVYFDRTVPALIGAMEAARTRLRAVILAGLRKPANEYPLEAAWTDVQAYEAAATLDNAVQAITEDAANRVTDANVFAQSVGTYTGAPEIGVAEIRRRMTARLRQLRTASDTATLRQIASGLSLQPPAAADASALYGLIINKLETDDTLAGTRTFARAVGVDPGGN